MNKTIPFTPAPAQLRGPIVVSTIKPKPGEIDVKEVGNRIDPNKYQEFVAVAADRAKQRRR